MASLFMLKVIISGKEMLFLCAVRDKVRDKYRAIALSLYSYSAVPISHAKRSKISLQVSFWVERKSCLNGGKVASVVVLSFFLLYLFLLSFFSLIPIVIFHYSFIFQYSTLKKVLFVVMKNYTDRLIIRMELE